MGFYDNSMLLIDFKFNIDFTTVDMEDVKTADGTEPGNRPRQTKKLVENRQQVKNLGSRCEP